MIDEGAFDDSTDDENDEDCHDDGYPGVVTMVFAMSVLSSLAWRLAAIAPSRSSPPVSSLCKSPSWRSIAHVGRLLLGKSR